MMMRVLHEGGMEIIADEDSLEPRKNNAFGIYEIKEYSGFEWLIDNPGKLAGRAVKIVTQYANIIESLAVKKVPMRLIFMSRSISAILKSLKNADMIWDPPPRESIALGRKIISYYKIPTMFVHYEEALKFPTGTCLRVKDWVGKNLDVDKMIAAIDPTQNHHPEV